MTDQAPRPAASTPPPAATASLSAHWFSRLALVLTGLVWLGVALGGLFYPDQLTGWTGIDLESRTARSEYRAVFGGLPAGLALVHLVAAFRSAWLRPGLWMATTLVVGLLAGRILTVVVDGVPGPVAWALTGAEGFLLVICLVGLWRLGFRDPEPAR